MSQQTESKQSWEIAIEKLATVTMDRFEKLEGKIDHMVNHNRSLEMQMGQLAEAINSRAQGNLPSKTEVNPKEHCKVVTLKSGKKIGEVSGENVVDEDEEEVPNQSHEEPVEDKSEEIEYKPPPVKPYVPPIPFPQRLKHNKLDK